MAKKHTIFFTIALFFMGCGGEFYTEDISHRVFNNTDEPITLYCKCLIPSSTTYINYIDSVEVNAKKEITLQEGTYEDASIEYIWDFSVFDSCSKSSDIYITAAKSNQKWANPAAISRAEEAINLEHRSNYNKIHYIHVFYKDDFQ